MTLSDYSIKNPVFAWMLMVGILVFGWVSYTRLGVSQLPDIDFPIVTVLVTWEGAAPEVMETDVTDIIEDAIMSVEGVKEVTSTSMQGMATITVELNLDRDIDAALQDVQTKINQAQMNLPRDIDPPIITKTNPEDQPIMWVALSGTRSLKDMTHFVSERLKDQFTTVSGVGNVFLGGFVDPNLRVWLDAEELREKELTVEDVLNAITSQHADLPAGYIDTGKQELNVRVYGEATSPEEFAKLVIPNRVRGGPLWKELRIGDVGTVEDGLADIRKISRSSGQAALGLGIVKQRGTNAVAVANGVKKKVADLQDQLPEGLQLEVVYDSTKFIKDSVHSLTMALILSVILTSIVCYFFLGTFSATFNVILSIPVSIFGAFIVMYFLGFTINTFTMLGLSLVIGIIVDDAIMVLENISRYQEKGYSRVQAAITGAREITSAALAASIAILAIFIPVIFMQGVIGKFFFQFGVTISIAVLFSLLEAFTIAPMRCSRFLQVGHTTGIGKFVDDRMHKVTLRYKKMLEWCLNHRNTVLIGAVLIFLSSFLLTKGLKSEFVPAQDQGSLLVRLMMPLGTSIEVTDKTFKEAEAFLLERGEVDEYYAAVGGFEGGEVNSGFIFVMMKDPEHRPKVDGRRVTQKVFMETLRKEFSALPGVERAIIQDLSLAGFTAERGFPIEFTLRGPDWRKLGEYGNELMKRMKESGMMTDMDTDYQLGMPELQILPSREKAAEHGVSVSSIANTINAMIGGVRTGKFTRNGKRYDIRVRLTRSDRSSPDDIKGIWVRNQYGEVVPLSEVVTTKIEPSLFSITRKNRERAISVFANAAAGHSQQEALEKVRSIAAEILPEDYRIVFSGGSQAFAESSASLLFALVMGIFVAYMVLATQFNSFIHPFTVLLALPFSVTGAFLALFISRNSMNLYSMIGLILLMGIVKKNSILLVDFTNERRREGLGVREALLEACPVRLRPILMTSVATVSAAIPEALAVGAGAETMAPMAVSIIGGVTVSTILTLFVVPCAYQSLSRFEKTKYFNPEQAKAGEPGTGKNGSLTNA